MIKKFKLYKTQPDGSLKFVGIREYKLTAEDLKFMGTGPTRTRVRAMEEAMIDAEFQHLRAEQQSFCELADLAAARGYAAEGGSI